MFVFCFLNFSSCLYYFLLLSLGLFIKQLRFFFFNFLRWMLGLLIAFLVYSFEAVNFPPKNVLLLAISHTFLDLFVLGKILQAVTIALVACYSCCSFPPFPTHPPHCFVKVYAIFIYNKLHIRKCII